MAYEKWNLSRITDATLLVYLAPFCWSVEVECIKIVGPLIVGYCWLKGITM